jgi:hypothetical protein
MSSSVLATHFDPAGQRWSPDRPIPWSRAAALRRWRTAIAWIVAIQGAASLVKVFVEVATRTGDSSFELLEIGEAVLLAVALVVMTRHAEDKLLIRPPKSLLVWQLGAFVSMAIWQTVLSLIDASPELIGEASFVAGHVLGGISFLLVAGWLLGAKLILSGIEDER